MSRVRLYVTCVLGLILLVAGLVVGLVIRNQVRQGLTRLGSVCDDKHAGYNVWLNTSDESAAPKYKMFYAFNATNVAEYLGQTTSPVDLALDLVGPYSMRQYEFKFDVEFNGNSEVTFDTLEQYEFAPEMSCPGCSNYEYVVGLNPALLKAMSSGPELVLGLSASAVDVMYGMRKFPPCTPENIQYSLTHPGCDPLNDTKCCCDSTPPTLPLNVQTSFSSCLVRAGAPTGVYSTFAGYDGGVKFNSPVFSTPVTSPLFVRKNLHEFGFGYPSAIAGLLTGLKVRSNVAQITRLAVFTQHALEACSFDPTRETAPKPETLNGKPYQYLGGISCGPIQAAFYWAQVISPAAPVKRCAAIGGEAGCRCVVPSHGDNGVSTTDKPCCTVVGLGCLVPVPGYVTDAWFMNVDHARSLSNGRTTQNTGCDSERAEEQFWWRKYRNVTETRVFSMQQRSPYTSPSQSDLSSVTPADFTPPTGYTAPVQGTDGTRFRPAGKTSPAFNLQLSNGNPKDTEALVFITQVRRAATVYRRYQQRVSNILVNRFEPSDTLLEQGVTANPPDLPTSVVGAGTPFSGVQDVSYLSGFNAYVSMPLFLYGDEAALTQNKCNGVACSGIQITRGGNRAIPREDNHSTYLLVEPATGLTLQAHKQLQASFALYPCTPPLCRSAGSFANLMAPAVPGGRVIPQYYMDETAAATSHQIDKFHAVMSINLAADVIMLAFPLVGATLIGFALVRWYRVSRRQISGTSRESLLE